ncbi:hypothetical protein B5M41_025290 [Shinella sumterensis]|nr:hypothetical protein [Shinella sumterensis]
MLTANCNGYRVDAASSFKGPLFECPKCGRVVTLKKGQIKTAHFAHKPPTDCTWLQAKHRLTWKLKQCCATASAPLATVQTMRWRFYQRVATAVLTSWSPRKMAWRVGR